MADGQRRHLVEVWTTASHPCYFPELEPAEPTQRCAPKGRRRSRTKYVAETCEPNHSEKRWTENVLESRKPDGQEKQERADRGTQVRIYIYIYIYLIDMFLNKFHICLDPHNNTRSITQMMQKNWNVHLKRKLTQKSS